MYNTTHTSIIHIEQYFYRYRGTLYTYMYIYLYVYNETFFENQIMYEYTVFFPQNEK